MMNEESTEITIKVPDLENLIWQSNPKLATGVAEMHMIALKTKKLEEKSQKLLDYARQTIDVAYQE